MLSSSNSNAYSLNEMRHLVSKMPKRKNIYVPLMEAVLKPDQMTGLEKERTDMFPFFLFLISQNGGDVSINGKKLPPYTARYIKLFEDKNLVARQKWYMNQFINQVRHNLALLDKSPNSSDIPKQIGSGFNLIASLTKLIGLGSQIVESYNAMTIISAIKGLIEVIADGVSLSFNYMNKWTMYFLIFLAWVVGVYAFLIYRAQENEREANRMKFAIQHTKNNIIMIENNRRFAIQTMLLENRERPLLTSAPVRIVRRNRRLTLDPS